MSAPVQFTEVVSYALDQSGITEDAPSYRCYA